MKQEFINKYLTDSCGRDHKKKKKMDESSELWFGSWSRPHMIWVRGDKVLYSNNFEFPTGSPMGEAEKKSARARGYILLDL